jgi:hypothetical protein
VSLTGLESTRLCWCANYRGSSALVDECEIKIGGCSEKCAVQRSEFGLVSDGGLEIVEVKVFVQYSH